MPAGDPWIFAKQRCPHCSCQQLHCQAPAAEGRCRFRNAVVDLKEIAAIRSSSTTERWRGYDIVLKGGQVVQITYSDMQSGDPTQEQFMAMIGGEWSPYSPAPSPSEECDCPCGLKDGCKCGDEE